MSYSYKLKALYFSYVPVAVLCNNYRILHPKRPRSILRKLTLRHNKLPRVMDVSQLGYESWAKRVSRCNEICTVVGGYHGPPTVLSSVPPVGCVDDVLK